MTNYSYQANSNRLSTVAGSTYVLDANGNTTSNGQHSFTYNTLNQLGSVDGNISYRYNALGQRVAKVVGSDTTTYVYSTAGQLLAEYTNGTLGTEYVYFNGAPLAVIRQGNVYYLHTDQLGTPRAVSDQNQKVVWSWASDPFGSTAANDDPDGDGVHFTLNLRFAGQYYDQETGLYYNYFRYYNPSAGRYITSDPIGLNGGVNTYGYVGGNPLRFSDKQGLFFGTVAGIILKRVGGAAFRDAPAAGKIGDAVGGGLLTAAGVHLPGIPNSLNPILDAYQTYSGFTTISLSGYVAVGIGGAGALGTTVAGVSAFAPAIIAGLGTYEVVTGAQNLIKDYTGFNPSEEFGAWIYRITHSKDEAKDKVDCEIQ